MSSRLKDYSYKQEEDGELPTLVTGKEANLKQILQESRADGGKNIVNANKIAMANKQLSSFAPAGDDLQNCKNSVNEPFMHKRKIPITIITGYLGSGKSTMLSKITRKGFTDMKIAVILNEFGDSSDIEKSMTIYNQQQQQGGTENSVTEWLDLGNGCLCCSVRDVGVKAIEDLVDRLGDEIDYIILETSGLADPGPIAKMFWLEEGLMSALSLDGIITVLDAEHINKTLEAKTSVAKVQIGMADAIVLNKMDKCHDEGTIMLKIKEINQAAPIMKTKFGELQNVNQILHLNAYDSATHLFSENKFVGENDHHKSHSTGMSTICIDFPMLKKQQQYEDLIKILQKLHWKNFGLDEYNFGDIHRTKGLIVANLKQNEDPTFSVIQGVRDTFEIIPGSPLENVNHCKLVLIGENLDRERIEKLLECLS